MDSVLSEVGRFVNQPVDGKFKIDKWKRLERFLILGVDQGTYYSDAKTLAVENARVVQECIDEDVKRVYTVVTQVSITGRAPKNDPAIFVIAMASAKLVDKVAIAEVCRTSTHLFHYMQMVKQFRGMGQSLMKALQYWYDEKTDAQLAYQMVKYRQRDGWTHRDVLRQVHPQHRAIYAYATHGTESKLRIASMYEKWGVSQEAYNMLTWFDEMQKADSLPKVIDAITYGKLPWETVPTQYLNEPLVWKELNKAASLPMGALIRNISRFIKMQDRALMDLAIDQLRNSNRLLASRIHPVQLLNTMGALIRDFPEIANWWNHNYDRFDDGLNRYRTFTHPAKTRFGSGEAPEIMLALNDAFHLCYGTVAPSDKRTLIAIDCSGSMNSRSIKNALFTCMEGAVAQAMVTLEAENRSELGGACMVVGFSSGNNARFTGAPRSWGEVGRGITPLNVDPSKTVAENAVQCLQLNWGSTDCSLPFIWADREGLLFDHFVVITDNETNSHQIPPARALQAYRYQKGIDAKLTVVGMTATEFSIADPNDAGMMDVVGYDTSTPNLISDFARS